jgi:predicted NAD/FAD-binding protein
LGSRRDAADPEMRLAIIGAGVSGLVCAHALQGEHEVVVFEAGERPGGHANTVHVETDRGAWDIDTGFIVFNDRNYPAFERLLEELGVASQPSEMSFGVSDGGAFEYCGASLEGLFAVRSLALSPSFHRMIADLVRFNRDARHLLRSDGDPSLREWLERRRYSSAFVERLIVPQASAVWSADPAQMWSFPARFLLEFFDNHGMLGFANRPHWRTIAGGSRNYVQALIAPLRERMRLSSPVRQVTRHPDRVEVVARGAEPECFDAVVLATHSDEALALLSDPSELELELLGAIPYQRNEAVLHTDRSLLPRRRRAWASWNYHLDVAHNGSASVTYHMNRLQSLHADREFCVTLNRTTAIDPTQIVATFQYAHPVYTPAGVAAQKRHDEISGHNRTHYCGAYWGWGFHEDGVQSALRVARELAVSTPRPVSV